MLAVFELESTMIDFGDTPIENIFIHDFMPMASGNHVKVYLLGYRYAQEGKSLARLDQDNIARALNMSKAEVVEAWRYWEGLGIVKYEEEEGKVSFVNLKRLYVSQHVVQEAPKVKARSTGVQELLDATADTRVNELFNQMDYYMRRQTVPSEKKRVLSWIKDYNMAPTVIAKAFFIGGEKIERLTLDYVEGIVRRWYDKGMTNDAALEAGLKEEDEAMYRVQRVLTLIGAKHRKIGKPAITMVEKWFEEYHYDWPMVEAAAMQTVNTSNPTIAYVDGVLKSWYEKGITSIEDIVRLDVKEKPKRVARQTKFHNFGGRRSGQNLDEIFKQKRNEEVDGDR